MKANWKTIATALAAAGMMAAASAEANRGNGGGHSTGGHSSRGHWGGGVTAMHGGNHWRSGGHYYGGGRHYGGGYRGWYGPRVGFYFGVPVFWGPYWGWDSYYYPREVVYREVIREPAYEGELVPPAAPAPSEGPTTSPYCASANAFFPAVRSCPEGWIDRKRTD